MAAIEIAGVSKTFGTHLAVDDLSLSVAEGSIYGFIGPNGSGKTTTLRMIMNILLPDRGAIHVLGRSGSTAARDDVGYLPEERGLYRKMSVGRLLQYYGALKGAASADIERELTFWLERLDLAKWRHHKIEALSKGMSQKVQFIATVIARPEAGDPRRAVLRSRSRQRRTCCARAVLELRRRGADHRLQHARHGRRRGDVRSHLHDLQGPQGARWHAGRDPGALRARHGPRADRGGRAARSTANPASTR